MSEIQKIIIIYLTSINVATFITYGIDKMKANIAEDMNLPLGSVSVKATTEEGLGFTGEGLGISSHAIVLLRED